MHISQADIARLPDDTIRRVVVRLREGCEPGAPLDPQHFPTRLAAALVRALKVRRSTLVGMEWDLLYDDEAEGCIVDAGFDPLEDWGRGWSYGPL
ncbi:MAG: hypothetical protein M3Q22_02920 [Actinomycetota bacterium]|nr:hypothetical protein [Actinomycetota bacterium]